jgi:hypothetical protein
LTLLRDGLSATVLALIFRAESGVGDVIFLESFNCFPLLLQGHPAFKLCSLFSGLVSVDHIGSSNGALYPCSLPQVEPPRRQLSSQGCYTPRT